MKKNKLSYQQKTGFRIPQNYFEDLEENLMRKISQEDIDVDNLKVAPGFIVPQDYFEKLEERVLKRVTKEQERGKIYSLFNQQIFYYAAAAAAIIVLLLSTNLFNNNAPQYTIDSVELSALEDYIDNGYMDFTFDEISSYITEEGNPTENFNVSALSDEEVFIYLSQDVEDPGLLIE
ncbi:hypothetical protein LZ575_05030 [Antarcticibacterium sp. 1MA-6-2]|uniref:hypothetical protein n=1 Tax=Antarcticibacterium sp. 1MA-6-2 TaxID=2908210 RepID=UPI001F28505D|nr:hypothetical protein [Antarcticibacterium sp. 1MA-6-2]UJH91995.1 hypothetical protein LZ575_05030 [Antarcticibacterium sp. 1MA-6-2]